MATTMAVSWTLTILAPATTNRALTRRPDLQCSSGADSRVSSVGAVVRDASYSWIRDEAGPAYEDRAAISRAAPLCIRRIQHQLPADQAISRRRDRTTQLARAASSPVPDVGLASSSTSVPRSRHPRLPEDLTIQTSAQADGGSITSATKAITSAHSAGLVKQCGDMCADYPNQRGRREECHGRAA